MLETNLPRRHFLTALGAGATLPLMGWPLRGLAAEGSQLLDEASGMSLPAEIHFLQRASFGITPDSVARIRQIGTAAYLEEQLNWQSLDDSAVESRIASLYPSVSMPDCDLINADPEQTTNDLLNARLLRAVHSKRQLYEVMVDFWTDHFNIYQKHSKQIRRLKTKDDREVIRRHALGTFRDLLTASARSPAMLVYLDNWASTAWAPIDNYARELLELHTLGVDGGYSEQDVKEVARCFTGWSISMDPAAWVCGYDSGFEYYDQLHDPDSKTVLGEHIAAGGGEQDGHRIIDILVSHPATVRFIARKLCCYFISDNPSEETVSAVSAAFGTDGDIKAMLRALLNSAEFGAAQGQRYRRPLQYVSATLRALQVPPGHIGEPYGHYITYLTGHVPYWWETPDGYPWEAGHWHNTHGSLIRWTFALLMAWTEHSDGSMVAFSLVENATTIDELVRSLSRQLIGSELPATQHQALTEYVSNGVDPQVEASLDHRTMASMYVTALLLSSAHFQLG